MIHIKPERRTLPVALTTEEKVQYGRNLANLHHEYVSVEISKKVAADEYKTRLEHLDARITSLARIVRNGEEHREVECHWRYLFEGGVKELVRMDTGEIVTTEKIDDKERQLLLQIDQGKQADTAAARAS